MHNMETWNLEYGERYVTWQQGNMSPRSIGYQFRVWSNMVDETPAPSCSVELADRVPMMAGCFS